MAKKATTSKRAPKRNGGTTPAPISLWQQLKQGNIKARCKELWSNCTHADNIRFIVGLCVMCISIYLIISFVSNVFTGRIDQSYVQMVNSHMLPTMVGVWEPTFQTTLWICALAYFRCSYLFLHYWQA